MLFENTDWKIRTQETKGRDAEAELATMLRIPGGNPGRAGLELMQDDSPQPCDYFSQGHPWSKEGDTAGFSVFSVSLFLGQMSPKSSWEAQGMVPENCKRALHVMTPSKPCTQSLDIP